MNSFKRLVALPCLVLSLAVAPVSLMQADSPLAVFSIEECEVKPQVLKAVQPEVPRELANLTGVVKVSFVISEEGKPVNCSVESSTNPELDRLALDSIARWQFSPAKRQGTAVAVKTMVPVRFKAQT